MKRRFNGMNGPANIAIHPATDPDMAGSVTELAAVAAATFPLACPPSADPADIAAHIRAILSAERFAAYLTDPDRLVLVARHDSRTVGYAMVVRDIGDPQSAEGPSPTVELSKLYVLPEYHRSGAASALMQAGLAWGAEQGATSVWLGVNQLNLRAQRFYAKHGFRVTGSRTFALGNSVETDFVMARPA